MLEASLLQRLEVYVNLLYVVAYFLVVEVPYLHLLSDLEQGHLVVVQVNHLVCVRHDGQGVGCDEELLVAFAYAYGERTALLCHHYFVWVGFVNHGYGVSTYDAAQRHYDSSLKVFAVFVLHELHQLHQHLGVRAAPERVALALQVFLQAGVVLYYSVVDQGEPPVLRHVGMGVHCRRFAVRCPSGVGYPYAA